ncbi:tyrosine-protein phosphatase [Protofrankia coriariae]|uniref:tyrosine-protein phosphatase n=1 Tax=Protofrankia coriariae TaxID=1562887 RepID=UPI0009784135|nr:tyrosine-protein phosphatase [Protofrankia coriariae]
MSAGRDLGWDGCLNVRDLGGLPTQDDRRLRRGALVRSGSIDRLSTAGWSALCSHDIRTIIDLRNDDEIVPSGRSSRRGRRPHARPFSPRWPPSTSPSTCAPPASPPISVFGDIAVYG